MSANSTAFDYVNGFRWRLGDPALADSEAHLYDLGVLRSVLEESVEIGGRPGEPAPLDDLPVREGRRSAALGQMLDQIEALERPG